jgi:DNA polymerase-1
MQLPLFKPASDWEAPNSLPNLAHIDKIALDTETRDPHLRTLGPGFIKGNGYMVGFSIAVEDKDWYFPLWHKDGGNLPNPIETVRWLKDLCAREDLTVIMHNAQYDLGWLGYHGIFVNGRIEDTQIRETLIHEEHPDGYSLDAVATRRLGFQKDERLLRDAAQAYGLDPKKDMWQFEARYVGPYAEKDARLTYDVFHHQQRDLDEWDLNSIAELERRLIKVVFSMSRRGVRVDTERAEQLATEWKKEELELTSSIGIEVKDIWKAEVLARVLEKEGISSVPRTTPTSKSPNGQVSVPNAYLESLFLNESNNPSIRRVAKNMLTARHYNRCRQTFIEDKLLNLCHRGRLHAHFVQLAREEEDGISSGTRTGRFASRNPNLQQIPVRSRYIPAHLIRHLFLPEEGYLWAKLDFDSQEPRLQCHYGLTLGLKGADLALKSFEQGIKLYSFMEQQVPGLNYDDCKKLVLAKSYGMQIKSLSENLNCTIGKAEEISTKFDSVFAYISILASKVSGKAQKEGYIRTIGGRLRRFDYWERRDIWDLKKSYQKTKDPETYQLTKTVFGEAEARKVLGDNIRRSFTYKAFNALIQGGSADQGKLALLRLSELEDSALHFPVHDEANSSVSSPEVAENAKSLAEQAVTLKVPTKCDLDLGGHWK